MLSLHGLALIFLLHLQSLDMEAECSDDVMKLRVKFNDTFSGLIYSAGKIMYFYFELIITLQNLHYLETYT